MTEYSMLEELVEKPISGEWGSGEGDVAVIRTANFTNIGRIDFTEVVSREISENKVQSKKLLIDDIIIEKSGGSPTQPVGRVVFFNSDGLYLCNNFTSVLRPLKKRVYPKYLHYILFCNHKFGFVRKYQNKTTGIINLQLAKYLKNTKIPLPPLPEQQKIAEILDAADKLRQKDQQLIEKYNALSQSLFLDMFGDVKHNHNNFKITTIGEVISEIKDGPHVSPKYSEEGIPILSTRNIRPFSLILNELKYVSTEMYETLTKRFSPRKGDVLLTKGGTTGYAKVVDFDWKFCIWVHIAALRPKANLISAKYLEAALNSHYCYHQSQLLTKGIANKDLGLKRIVNIVLLLPPITLQNQFAERIQAIEAQKQQAQASLQKSEDLFNSLLQRAFKAELNG